MEAKQEALKEKLVDQEPESKREPEEIKPEDADKIVGGRILA